MTRRSSRLRTWWLCSAWATAERRTFSTIGAAARGVYWSVASASPTDFPRIWSSTSRAFRADTGTKRARASVRTALRLPRGRGRSLLSRAVRLERAGHRELTQPVTDHVLRDVDRDELLAVVDGERVADELRRDRRAARPRLQHLLLPAPVQLLHPREQPSSTRSCASSRYMRARSRPRRFRGRLRPFARSRRSAVRPRACVTPKRSSPYESHADRVRPSTLALLVDPASGERVRLAQPARDDETVAGVLVGGAGRTYPVRDGIPRFVPPDDQAQTQESFGYKR